MSALVAVGTMILVQKFIRGTLCPQLVELTVSDWRLVFCILVSDFEVPSHPTADYLNRARTGDGALYVCNTPLVDRNICGAEPDREMNHSLAFNSSFSFAKSRPPLAHGPWNCVGHSIQRPNG